MKISIGTIDKSDNRVLIGEYSGKLQSGYSESYIFDTGEIKVSDITLRVKSTISVDNYKGNFLLLKNGTAFIDSLITLDDSFVLMVNLEDEWVEFILTK